MMNWLYQWPFWLCIALAMPCGAQLAITEVMTWSSRTSLPAFRGPDYWELTNFGTNANLTGYTFSDRKDIGMAPTNLFTGIVIGSGESIVFCRSNTYVRTPEHFAAWWGTNFRTSTRVFVYVDPGFNEVEDVLTFRGPGGQMIEQIDLTEATDGRSFTFDPLTGEFGALSEPERGCAFVAAMTDDVGSPGCHSGRISLGFIEQPASQVLSSCGNASLRVVARGMPRPKYQWFLNGEVLEGANRPTLQVAVGGIVHEGAYHVVLSNGLEVITSQVATISLSTNPVAPLIEKHPEDLIAFPSQTAVFEVRARGYPCPNYQWQCYGTNLPGETAPILQVQIPDDAAFGTREYTVRIFNDRGETNARARLTITDWPLLKITEVMSDATDPLSLHQDWFELTNDGPEPVDLKGYRLADVRTPDAMKRAFVISNSVVIKPGESVVFIEGMSRGLFFDWWGFDNLPRCLQVVRWAGFSLGATGDTIYLWNPAAQKTNETVSTALFGRPCPETSLEFDPVMIECYGAYGGCVNYDARCAIAGVSGAFVSLRDGNVGSPGNIGVRPPPGGLPPRISRIWRDGSGVWITCEVMPGKQYRLTHKTKLSDPVWIGGPLQPANGLVMTLLDATAGNAAMRFYRLEEICE